MDRLLKLNRDAMTTRHSAPLGQCPDAETLAAWADGTIYGAEADGLEAHLADCQRCQAVLATFAATEPEPAQVPVASEQPAVESAGGAVVPFRPRPSPLRWAVPLIAGTAAASLILYMFWPKGPALDQAATVARNEPVAPAPVRSIAPRAEADAPLRTPSIGPAPKEPATKATQIAAQKPGVTTPAATPALPPPLPTSAGASGQVLRPTPIVVLPPTPAATSPTPAAASSDLARVGMLPVSANSNATLAQTRSDRNELSFIMNLAGGGVEFGPVDPIAEVTLTPTRQGEAPRSPLRSIRWRVISGIVEKTINGGTTWTKMALDPALGITSGASPSTVVCWLVGKAGAVMRSTDGGTTWTRVKAPASTDLVSITATDDQHATVSTADGQRLTTVDGGQTWHK